MITTNRNISTVRRLRSLLVFPAGYVVLSIFLCLSPVLAQENNPEEPSLKEAKAKEGYILNLKDLIKKSKKKIENVNKKLKEQAVQRRNQQREEKAREYYEKAMRLFDNNKFEEAQKLWMKAIKITEHPEMKGYVRESVGKSSKQEKALRSEEDRRLRRMEIERGYSAKEVEEVYQTGVKLFKQKKYIESKTEFELVEEMFPDHKAARSYLMIIDREIEKEQRAIIERKLKEESVTRRREKDEWKKDLMRREKEQEKNLQNQAETLYMEALGFYKMRQFKKAKDKFREVEWIRPDYKKTIKYLSRIDKDIVKEEKRRKINQKEAFEKELWEEREARLSAEEKRIKLRERGEIEEIKRLKEEAEFVYQAAISLYKKKFYVQARDKFEDVEGLYPDYRSTKKYLQLAEKKIEQQQQKFRDEQARSDRRYKDMDNLESQHEKDIESLKAEHKKIRSKEEQKRVEKEAAVVYQSARTFYKNNLYDEAKERFLEVHRLIPGYRSTEKYLKRLGANAKEARGRPSLQKASEAERSSKRDTTVLEAVEQRKEYFNEDAEKKYQEGLSFYKAKNFAKAKIKFIQIEAMYPGYKDTLEYLDGIDERIGSRRQWDSVPKDVSISRSRPPKQTMKAIEMPETKKERKKLAAELYKKAVHMYKKQFYLESAEKFAEVERVWPGYRSSKGYLKKINRDMGKELEVNKKIRDLQLPAKKRAKWEIEEENRVAEFKAKEEYLETLKGKRYEEFKRKLQRERKEEEKLIEMRKQKGQQKKDEIVDQLAKEEKDKIKIEQDAERRAIKEQKVQEKKLRDDEALAEKMERKEKDAAEKALKVQEVIEEKREKAEKIALEKEFRAQEVLLKKREKEEKIALEKEFRTQEVLEEKRRRKEEKRERQEELARMKRERQEELARMKEERRAQKEINAIEALKAEEEDQKRRAEALVLKIEEKRKKIEEKRKVLEERRAERKRKEEEALAKKKAKIEERKQALLKKKEEEAARLAEKKAEEEKRREEFLKKKEEEAARLAVKKAEKEKRREEFFKKKEEEASRLAMKKAEEEKRRNDLFKKKEEETAKRWEEQKLLEKLDSDKKETQKLLSDYEEKKGKESFLTEEQRAELAKQRKEMQSFIQKDEERWRRRWEDQVNEMYREALELYKQGDFYTARLRFSQVQGISPGYQSTEKYLGKLNGMKAEDISKTRPSLRSRNLAYLKGGELKEAKKKLDGVIAIARRSVKEKEYVLADEKFDEAESMLLEKGFPKDYADKMRSRIKKYKEKMGSDRQSEGEKQENIAQRREEEFKKDKKYVAVQKEQELEALKEMIEKQERELVGERNERIHFEEKKEGDIAALEEKVLRDLPDYGVAEKKKRKRRMSRKEREKDLEKMVKLRQRELEREREKILKEFRESIGRLYRKAIEFEKEKSYEKAKKLFLEIESMSQDYKKTRSYILRIDKKIKKQRLSQQDSLQKSIEDELFSQKRTKRVSDAWEYHRDQISPSSFSSRNSVVNQSLDAFSK